MSLENRMKIESLNLKLNELETILSGKNSLAIKKAIDGIEVGFRDFMKAKGLAVSEEPSRSYDDARKINAIYGNIKITLEIPDAEKVIGNALRIIDSQTKKSWKVITSYKTNYKHHTYIKDGADNEIKYLEDRIADLYQSLNNFQEPEVKISLLEENDTQQYKARNTLDEFPSIKEILEKLF